MTVADVDGIVLVWRETRFYLEAGTHNWGHHKWYGAVNQSIENFVGRQSIMFSSRRIGR